MASVFAVACGGTPAARVPQYTAFYAKQPRSILIVPPVNESPEVDATPVFLTTITTPLAERGYYVFPVALTDALLKDLGLTEAGMVHEVPPAKFHELFGADAVLLISIKDWTTQYVVLQSATTVTMQYTLKDTRTGETLWTRSQTVERRSGGAGGGNPLASLIVMAIDAAVTAVATDYRPLAQQANFTVLSYPGHGIPAGPYHPSYKKDGDLFY